MRTQYRKIFTQMGFEEMPTNNYVESSFWNFDALFQPQQHPARDAHDTFFLTHPATSDTFPEDYLARVKVGACGCGVWVRAFLYLQRVTMRYAILGSCVFWSSQARLPGGALCEEPVLLVLQCSVWVTGRVMVTIKIVEPHQRHDNKPC